VPLALLHSRESTSSLATGFFTGAAYMGGFFLASLLLVQQFDYSLTSAVPILSIRPALFALMSPVGGRVAGRAGTRIAAIAGSLTLAAGMMALAVGSAIESLVIVVVGGFVLQGMGFGLLRPAITTALADAVEEHDLGMAGAAERLTGQVGVAFGITILATVYDGDLDRFAPAFAVGAVFALVGAVTAWSMLRRADAEQAAVAVAAAAAGRAAGGTPLSDGTGAVATKAPADEGDGPAACRTTPARDRSARGDDCGDRAGYSHQTR
jgi:MFS family permease